MQAAFSISRMTLGTAQLGMDYGIANREGRPDEEKAFRIINTALENGINCLDTAAAYGSSEELIGKYLDSYKGKRGEIIIVTKFSVGQMDVPEPGIVIMKSVEQSLTRLKTGYLDILLLHNSGDFSIYGKEITRTIERLLSEGIIKAAGASCYDFSEAEPMLDNDIFYAFQMPVNLLGAPVEGNEQISRFRNKLIFARSIFLQGLFFMNPEQLKGNLIEASPYISLIQEIASGMNISISELAIAYVQSLGYVDSLVIGADNPSQVAENAKYTERHKLAPGITNTIRERLKGAPGWLLKPYLWDKQEM